MIKTLTHMLITLVTLATFNVNAALITDPCDTGDVQINFIKLLNGVDPGTSVSPIDSSECYGAFEGNNSLFTNPTMGNLGYDNDGWLNEEADFWPGLPGAFITNADLFDLDGDTEIDDPGWIYLGKDEGAGFKGETSTDGVTEYTFIDDLLTMSNCKDKNDGDTSCVGGDAVKGDWAWTPPATNPDALLDLLGGMFFDKVAVIFKSSKRFAMYSFDIGDLGLDPVLAGDFNFAFEGTWDMSETLINKGGNPAGLSNVSLWARDPIIPVEIPEPSYLGLFAVILILVHGCHRRRCLKHQI